MKLQQDHPLAPLSAAVVARTVEAMTGGGHMTKRTPPFDPQKLGKGAEFFGDIKDYMMNEYDMCIHVQYIAI